MRRLFASFVYALGNALQNFVRNVGLSIAGIVTMTLILIVVGGVIVGAHSVGVVVDQQKTHASKLQIYIQDSVGEASIANFQQHLASDPRVASVDFTSKDQALQISQQRGDDVTASVQLLGGNPLPASIDVTTKKLDDISAMNTVATASPLHDSSKTPTDYDANVTSRLIGISNWVTIGGIILSVMFGFISLVIIMVTIRTAVFARRTEIEIMKLVGATDWFVRWPFILEGVLSGVIAAVISAGGLMLLYRGFINLFHNNPVVSVPYEGGFALALVGFTLVAGCALGGCGSYLGVRRFLSV